MEFFSSSVEQSFVFWSSSAMPALAESSFFLKFVFDECRAVMSVERGSIVWRGGPTCPLDGIGEELDCLFNVFSSFEGDIEG
jgi:hypothetical protein